MNFRHTVVARTKLVSKKSFVFSGFANVYDKGASLYHVCVKTPVLFLSFAFVLPEVDTKPVYHFINHTLNFHVIYKNKLRDVTLLFHEICALLEYNAASSGNPLPTFRDNVSVPSSRVMNSKKSRLDP
jgi:hypothetical protein